MQSHIVIIVKLTAIPYIFMILYSINPNHARIHINKANIIVIFQKFS